VVGKSDKGRNALAGNEVEQKVMGYYRLLFCGAKLNLPLAVSRRPSEVEREPAANRLRNTLQQIHHLRQRGPAWTFPQRLGNRALKVLDYRWLPLCDRFLHPICRLVDIPTYNLEKV
jgi:hypothetical protein